MRRLRPPKTAPTNLLTRLRTALNAHPTSTNTTEHPLTLVDDALSETSEDHLRVSILTLAATSLPQRDPSIIDPLLERANSLPRGQKQRVYNAAVSSIARDRTRGDRTDRALAIVERMRGDGVKPSNYTIQHVFAAARGETSGVDHLLDILSEQMRKGLRPSRAAFDSLLAAAPLDDDDNHASSSDAPPPPASSAQPRLPLLLQVLDACSLRPNGTTIRGLARLARSTDDVRSLEPLLHSLPHKPRSNLLYEGLLPAAHAKVDPIAAAEVKLMRGGAPFTSDAEWRGLLWACASHSNGHGSALVLLEAMWAKGKRADERTARRLLHAAGEGVARGEAGALQLLLALRNAMFGDGFDYSVSAQRSGKGKRRSETAEHEAVRVLTRASWVAGLEPASVLVEQALQRLEAADVRARPRMVGACAYLNAAEMDFDAALSLLASPPSGTVSPLGEGPYLALLSAVRKPEHIEHAVSALRLMLSSGVVPTLRTRIAVARMAARVQRAPRDPHTERAQHAPGYAPLPGSSSFWRPTGVQLPWDSLFDALRREEGPEKGAGAVSREVAPSKEYIEAAADLVLDARTAALLERIATLMKASGDGGAMASLLSEAKRL